jgi:hypothetical protein
MNRSVVTRHWTARWRSHRVTSRWIAGSGVRRRSGRGGTRVAWAGPLALSVPPPLQPDRKAVGRHHGDRTAVNTWPQPALVPTQLALGLLMELLDGIPAVGIAGQLLQRGLSGQVAPAKSPRCGPYAPLSWLG